MMNALQISLFGRFDVCCNGEPVAGLEGRKAQELLAFLLLQRSRIHSREYLAEMLWGQRSPAQSKKYLRQTLWQLHSALAVHDQEMEDISPLLVDEEWVRFNQRCDLWLDVAVFEAAYDEAQGIAGGDLDDARAGRLRQAVELYRGDLLQVCYEDWCLFERERLQNMYLAMLDKLMDCCQEHGQYEMGLGYGATILRYDRARERTHRRMMRLYYLAGDRTSALRQYDQLAHALREELDVEPARRSLVLCDQIRADSFDTLPPPSNGRSTGSNWSGEGITQADPRLHLRHLHRCLTEMQRQIKREIEVIELALAEA
jgi:DNA-binding SARP family transcriptional activator